MAFSVNVQAPCARAAPSTTVARCERRGRRRRRAGASVAASAASSSSSPGLASLKEAPLTLHATDDSSVKVLVPIAQAPALVDAVNDLIRDFQAIKAGAESGKRVTGKSLQYRLESGALRLDLECNPNIFPNAMHAKVYLKVDDGRVSVSTQALLPRVIESVRHFKTHHLADASA